MNRLARVYYLTNSGHGLLNLRHRRLKIAELGTMNDPYECMAADMPNREARKAFNDLKARLTNSRGAICFSRGFANPVLWSHYAHKHHGVCFGFDVPRHLLVPMQYDADRLPDVLPKLLTGDPTSLEKAMKRLLSTKFRDWKYENESRLYVSLANRDSRTGLCFLEFNAQLVLKELMLGARSNGNASVYERLLASQYPGVHLQQMRLAFRRFAVVPLKATATIKRRVPPT